LAALPPCGTLGGNSDLGLCFSYTIGAEYPLSAGSIVDVILTEKPSVAHEIAAFVGARTRHDGYLEGGGYQVTWAYGHLVELKEPHDYDPALSVGRWNHCRSSPCGLS
jgi:hypothetical protein